MHSNQSTVGIPLVSSQIESYVLTWSAHTMFLHQFASNFSAYYKGLTLVSLFGGDDLSNSPQLPYASGNENILLIA